MKTASSGLLPKCGGGCARCIDIKSWTRIGAKRSCDEEGLLCLVMRLEIYVSATAAGGGRMQRRDKRLCEKKMQCSQVRLEKANCSLTIRRSSFDPCNDSLSFLSTAFILAFCMTGGSSLALAAVVQAAGRGRKEVAELLLTHGALQRLPRGLLARIASWLSYCSLHAAPHKLPRSAAKPADSSAQGLMQL